MAVWGILEGVRLYFQTYSLGYSIAREKAIAEGLDLAIFETTFQSVSTTVVFSTISSSFLFWLTTSGLYYLLMKAMREGDGFDIMLSCNGYAIFS